MTDLNELKKFEEDLKLKIDERNNFKPVYSSELNETYKPNELYTTPTFYAPQTVGTNHTDMGILEHGRPFDTAGRTPNVTLIGVPEHCRPSDTSNKEVINATYMGVPEHGRPFDTYRRTPKTLMGVPEHGRHFDTSNNKNKVLQPIEIYNFFGFNSLNDLYKHMENSTKNL
jgi:hypothetical protein